MSQQEGSDSAHRLLGSGGLAAPQGLERFYEDNGLCSETEQLKERWKVYVENEYTGVNVSNTGS